MPKASQGKDGITQPRLDKALTSGVDGMSGGHNPSFCQHIHDVTCDLPKSKCHNTQLTFCDWAYPKMAILEDSYTFEQNFRNDNLTRRNEVLEHIKSAFRACSEKLNDCGYASFASCYH